MAGGGQLVRVRTLKAMTPAQRRILKRRVINIIDASHAIRVITMARVPGAQKKRVVKKRAVKRYKRRSR
jgi:hypothetical protein